MALPTLSGFPQILGQLDPNAVPQKKSFKDIFLQLLPLIISGTAGGIFGGQAGLGSALSSYAQVKQIQDELEERKSAAQAAQQARVIQAQAQIIREREQTERAKELEDIRSKNARALAEFTQGKISERAAESRKFQERPADIAGIVAAIQGGKPLENVPATLAGPTISAIGTAQRQKEQQGFQVGQQKAEQEFQLEQQKRQQEFQARENQRNRSAQMEAAKTRAVVSEQLKDLPTPVQAEIETTASLLKVLSEMEKAAPTLSKIQGPVAGRFITPAKQYAGQTSKEEEEALATVQKFFNVLAKATSGGAVTPQEEARLKRELTQVSLTPEQLAGRIKVQTQYFNTKLKLRINLLTSNQRKRAVDALSSIGVNVTSPSNAEEYLKKFNR